MESYFEKGRHGHDYVVVALGIFFRMVTKKFKLPQYFYWYNFLKKNKKEIIFIE